MRLHLPFRRHNQTAHIQVETALCQACGRCVEACPNGVLRLVGFLAHRHVRIGRADLCQGCRKCVRACASGAIKAQPRSQPARRRVA